MNPFECERLGWDEIRGLPIVPDANLGTGSFRIICSRDQEGEGIEEAEALGIPIEVAVPSDPKVAPSRSEGRSPVATHEGDGRVAPDGEAVIYPAAVFVAAADGEAVRR